MDLSFLWIVVGLIGIIAALGFLWVRAELRRLLLTQSSSLDKSTDVLLHDMQKGTALLQNDLLRVERVQQQLLADSSKFYQTLRGDQSYQGQWGEMVLEQVLSSAGLREGNEFLLQPVLQVDSSSGPRTLRPDIILSLPDERQLVIDAKVSLEAFWRYRNATSDSEREEAEKGHIDSVSRHVEALIQKSYHTHLRTPGFTLLFSPIEAAIWLVIDRAPELVERAWKNGVLLASPTSIIPTLKTVSALWRAEKQTKSIRELAKEGGLLYERFISLVEDVEKMERHLRQAQECRDSIDRKLRGGRLSLAGRIEKLKELGASSNKTIPKDWIEDQV